MYEGYSINEEIFGTVEGPIVYEGHSINKGFIIPFFQNFFSFCVKASLSVIGL